MPTTQIIPQKPLITFIVTTYNLPIDYLKECLKSIMALSLNKEQREVILVDDGSAISPLNELNDMQDDIIYIRQPNHGISVARNIGIKMATGEFIQFIDGDDCLIQADYEHCLDIIRYQEPVDIVLFQASQSKNSPVDFSYEGPTTGVHYMETHNLRGAAWGYIFRANRLGDLRFTPGTNHGEDEEFTPQLILKVHNLYATKAKAYYYRTRKDSATNKKTAENKEARLNDTLDVILRLQSLDNKLEDKEKKEALQRRIAQLSMDYLVNVIRLTRSMKQLKSAIQALTENNLYPLPNKNYTKKYVLFNHLIKNKVGRIALMTLL